MAKEVLCVPSTSTPSERTFSAAGLIVNEPALHGDNVDAIVFLNKNMPKLFDMTREVDDHMARFVKSETQKGSSSAPRLLICSHLGKSAEFELV